MILIDAGPLVALNDKRDVAHASCQQSTAGLPREPLITTWPCVAEAMYLLGTNGGFTLQASLWAMWRNGYIDFIDLTKEETKLAYTFMERYRDLPMDLADATLIALADFRGWKKIFTLDSHFFAYRLGDGSVPEVILPAKLDPRQ
jgi:uncharacterized protein